MLLTDHKNPGTTDPSGQAYPPVLPSASTPCSCPLTQSTGETQRPATVPGRAAASPRGLPVNVDACSQNLSRPVPNTVAAPSPPAKNSRPGERRPGGIPVEVMVK